MTAEFEDDATDVGTVSKQREVSGRRRGTKDEENVRDRFPGHVFTSVVLKPGDDERSDLQNRKTKGDQSRSREGKRPKRLTISTPKTALQHPPPTSDSPLLLAQDLPTPGP